MKTINDYTELATIERKLDQLHAGEIGMSVEEENILLRKARNLADKINSEQYAQPHYSNAPTGSIWDY